MVYNSPEKKVLPAAGDTYAYIDEMRALAASIRDVVAVANRAEGDAIAAAMATDGRAVTDANLLWVFNNETKNLEVRDSAGWRPMIGTNPMGHMGKVDGFQDIGTGTVCNFTAAQILRGGVTFDNPTSSLVVPYTGLYRISYRMLATNGTHPYTSTTYLTRNTVSTGVGAYTYKPTGSDYTSAATATIPLTAGDKVALYLSHDTGGATAKTWGTTGYNGSYVELEMVGT